MNIVCQSVNTTTRAWSIWSTSSFSSTTRRCNRIVSCSTNWISSSLLAKGILVVCQRWPSILSIFLSACHRELPCLYSGAAFISSSLGCYQAKVHKCCFDSTSKSCSVHHMIWDFLYTFTCHTLFILLSWWSHAVVGEGAPLRDKCSTCFLRPLPK